MHEQTLRRLHADFHPKRCYTELYNPRRPPTPEEFTLDMNVEVESLRLKVPLPQPPLLSQYDLSPRRLPAAGTGLGEAGVPHPEMQRTEQEESFPFQAGVDDVLHVDCMRIPEQEGTPFFQADVGVNPETTTVQVAARHEFTRLPKSRQQ